MANRVQLLIAEIDRVQKTQKTMVKRLRKQDAVISKAKKYLREFGIRPYNKRTERTKPNKKVLEMHT